MEMALVIQRYCTGVCALLFLLWFSLPLSLGARNLFPIEEYITYNTTYMHEYGHYIQSQQTGYLYALTAACSFLATKWIYAGEAVFSQKDWVPRVNFFWSEVH